jgi:hypothetical protein
LQKKIQERDIMLLRLESVGQNFEGGALQMMKIAASRGVWMLALGILIGLVLSNRTHFLNQSTSVMAQEAAKNPAADLAAMQADIAHLKEVVPSQSHTMTDVGFQFANLWFAGKQQNWPLAEFFLNESRQHIAWTIRIRPIRKDPAGNPVDIKAIFDTISDGPLKDLTQSIQNKSEVQFSDSYKQMLTACYSCHLASGKPFLRPVIPKSPPQSIISFGSAGEKSE